MDERLQHDAAWAAATSLIEELGGAFREVERRDVFALMYETIKSGIESYSITKRREMQRIKPSDN